MKSAHGKRFISLVNEETSKTVKLVERAFEDYRNWSNSWKKIARVDAKLVNVLQSNK